MLGIRFKGTETVDSPDQTKDRSSRPIWLRLVLYDESRGTDIPEDFYVVACTKKFFNEFLEEYKRRGVSLSAIQIQPQENLDKSSLERFAQKKFEELSFKDWDEFYIKMQTAFVYDE